MKDSLYLVLSDKGFERATKRAPSLYRNEVAVLLKLSIPDSAFRSLTVSATLEVQEEQVIQPTLEIDIVEPPVSD